MAKSSNDDLLGAIAYLGGFISGIILLVLEKKSSYVRFHAMQSTIIFLVIFVLGFIPLIGAIATISGFIIWIIMMWKAFNGEKYKLPIVGDFAESQLKNFK